MKSGNRAAASSHNSLTAGIPAAGSDGTTYATSRRSASSPGAATTTDRTPG